MNCPLIQPKIEFERDEEMVRMGRCTEEECAWWDKTRNQCAILRLSINLEAIAVSMVTLTNKMPHAGQLKEVK